MALPNLTNPNFLADLQKHGLSEDQFWAKTLQKMIVLERDNFVFSTLAKKVTIPKKAGTKIWTTRRYLHLPVDLEKGKLAEGVAPTPMKVEGKTVSGTVNQYGAYIELTDVAQDIHFDDIFNIYQPELARHAAETIERDLLEAIYAEASVRFVGNNTNVSTITASDVLSFDDVRRAWVRMKNHFRKGHSAFGGKPVLVAHPNVLQDLLDDNALKDLIIVPGYDEKPIKSGSISQYIIYGIYFIESAILEPVAEGASNANVYKSILVGNDAFALLNLGSDDVKWYKKGFVADSSDPLGQKSTLGYKLWTGGKVIDPMAISIIHSGSGFDAEVANWGIDADARPANQYGVEPSDIVVKVAQKPFKLDYVTTDTELDLSGLIVTIKDSYGSDIMVEQGSGIGQYTVTLPASNPFTAGTKTATVTYKASATVDKTTTFTYTVTSA